MTFKELTGTVG